MALRGAGKSEFAQKLAMFESGKTSSVKVKTEKFYKPGFFNLPHFFPCQHPEHSPPSMLHVPNGQGYRHICPKCGNISILTSLSFLLKL